MIDLYKTCLVPYDDKNISREPLVIFTQAHLALVIADSVAGAVALELTGVDNALDALGVTASDEGVKLGLQKARIVAKNNFRATLPNQISRIYGAALEAYGQQGGEVNAIFPDGRDIFSQCKDGILGEKLVSLDTAATAHAAALGAPMVALATALKTDWAAIFQAASDAKGAKGSSATARRQDVEDLKTALGLLLLELGKQLLRQRERMRSLLPQHLLGQPVDEDNGDEDSGGGEPTPEPPTAPQNVGVVLGAAGTGEAGLTCDPVEGADGYKLFHNGTLMATSATLPVLFTFTPGEALLLTLRAYNAAGDSDPSDTLSAEAP